MSDISPRYDTSWKERVDFTTHFKYDILLICHSGHEYRFPIFVSCGGPYGTWNNPPKSIAYESLDEDGKVDDEATSDIVGKEKSPLLRLPTELRLMVYEYVFGGFIVGTANLRSRCVPHHPPNLLPQPPWLEFNHSIKTNYKGGSNSGFKLFGLLRTCKKVYKEAAYLFYSINYFSGFSPRSFSHFLSILTQAQQHSIHTVSSLVTVGHPQLESDLQCLRGLKKLRFRRHIYDVHLSISHKDYYEKLFKSLGSQNSDRNIVFKLKATFRNGGKLLAEGVTGKDSSLRWMASTD
ncbi:unnamed protein product [Periconia digitata]|uniref:DUF7730 domain-containing protein n=1 Tax=Periconia digitata TaxID=1303443 RepID=A0A9W4U5A7_9PLEO|nr:unnamed protein product [Periconia digitata]